MKNNAKKYFNEQGCIKKHFSWVFYNFDDICGVFKTITHFMTIWPTVHRCTAKNSQTRFALAQPILQPRNKCIWRGMMVSVGRM